MEQPPTGAPPSGAKNRRQLRLEIPGNLSATYANTVIVTHTYSEIVLDFVQVMPNDPRARVQSRIVMTPANARLFLNALKDNLQRFEDKHGEIKLPPRPISLADQLFGTIKQDETDDDPQEADDE